jgi:hypothetical protein
MESNLFFPNKTYYYDRSSITVDSKKSLLERGIDPKPLLMDLCQPMCEHWKAKLNRCEDKLKEVIKISPTKTCLYPMRDYVTCVEACVSELQLSL